MDSANGRARLLCRDGVPGNRGLGDDAHGLLEGAFYERADWSRMRGRSGPIGGVTFTREGSEESRDGKYPVAVARDFRSACSAIALDRRRENRSR